MSSLEHIISGMRDLESRFEMLGKTRKKYKHMPKEEYPTYRGIVSGYMNGLRGYRDIYYKVSEKMESLLKILGDIPESAKQHRENMKSYIYLLRDINGVLKAYTGTA